MLAKNSSSATLIFFAILLLDDVVEGHRLEERALESEELAHRQIRTLDHHRHAIGGAKSLDLIQLLA